ncbi:hypothetical protein BGZ96_006550 [Linnemannia gamsii]|uniref:Uncharacterized protein n=1 Tax=Linnemannia gamsii TaxID=64522 RepID=A0ABQ7K245_9FUNG|nr:hypothetical protein BGZ96_006550 [Linnemannia gamsii]
MYFPTFTVSMAFAILVLSATTSAASSFDACDFCIDKKMISVEPACANLPKNITKSKNGDYLTHQHYKCYCGVPSSKAWYKSCKAKIINK